MSAYAVIDLAACLRVDGFSKNEIYGRDDIIMTHIICIANQKGGVGKTTTAINLSAALSAAGKKILLVDCDSQANTTTGMGVDKGGLALTLYHGLIGDADVSDIILKTDIKRLWLIPARVELIGFEFEMLEEENRETILKQMLQGCKDRFDFIILDCPPSLSLLTINAMAAANGVLIPLQSEFYALEGLGQLLQTIKRIKRQINPDLQIEGILMTMFDRRTNLSGQVAEDAEKYFKNQVFKTRIPRSIRLAEAPSFGKSILLYDPASIGAKCYLSLAREIIKGRKLEVREGAVVRAAR